MAEQPRDLTVLLQRFSAGEPGAEDRLVGEIYPVLRRLAARKLKGEQHRPLATTELAHEAYLDLFHGGASVDWQNRRHFIALASQVVRRVVVDFARERRSLKRGGDAIRVDIELLDPSETHRDEELLALDDALEALSRVDGDAAKVTELRFFGGLNAEEIAVTLGSSTATVTRRWRFAKAWLRRRLEPAAV